MTRFFTIAVALLLLGSCTPPEPVFTSELDVRDALAQIQNARFTAQLSNDVEASDSHWEREVQIDWLRSHAVGDSAYDLAWQYDDAFIQDGDTSRYWGHLWANRLTSISSDSLRKASDWDAASSNNANGIPNYYASMTLPVMLTDTSWWAAQVSDSAVRVTWEHVLPSADQTEQFILTKTSIQDTTDADYHPDTEDVQRWVFAAPHGLPVRYEQSWYRGDMAYGSDLAIDWEWELTNNGAVELAVADWVAPEWSREPEEAPAVAGGGDGDWFAEAMAALPAVGVAAPAIDGVNLAGESTSLGDLAGDLVYVDFWYIGCGPCMRALPHLEHMEEEFGPAGFHVLGVNHHQDAKTVKRYLDRRGLDIPQAILDSLPEGYPVVAYPTWFLVGRDGSIIDRNMGYGEDTGAFLDSLVSANL